MIRAAQLQPGLEFKRPGQVDWKIVAEIKELGTGNEIPLHKRGHLLLILKDKRKVIYYKDEWVAIKEAPVKHQSLSNN